MTADTLGSVSFDHWKTQTIGQITPLYVRGTGFHQGGTRMVQVGSTSLVPSEQITSKGLGFLKLDRTTHQPIPLSNGSISTVQNTHTSTKASTTLAQFLNEVTENEIGILTSCDRFEGSVNEALQTAAQRVGLSRLVHFIQGKRTGTDAMSQRAYAAIFSGAGSQTRVQHAWEAFESNGEHAPAAIISTFLIDGGFGAQSAPSELVPADPNASMNPGVIVDKLGMVGIGTRTPTEQLDVNGNVRITSGKLFGNVVGKASSAHAWTTPRTLTLEGDISGSVTWDGSSDVSLITTLTSIEEKVVTVPFGGTGRTSFPEGSVLVGNNADPVFTPSALVWDEENLRLGIGTTSPTETLEVAGNLVVSDTLQTSHVIGNVTGNVFGNADTASHLLTPRTINGISFDGTENIVIPVDIVDLKPLTPGEHLSGSNYDGEESMTWDVISSSVSTPKTIVARDEDGDFHANVIHAFAFDGKLERTVTFVDGTQSTVATFDNTMDVTVPVGSGINASIDASGAPEYTGFQKVGGAFYGGSSDPTSNTRLNYDGDLYVANLIGSTIGIDATAETLTCSSATVGEDLFTKRFRCKKMVGEEARFHISVSAPTFETVSDQRLKSHIRPIERASEKVWNWNGVTFRWKQGEDSSEQIGVLAQDIQKECPQAVVEGDDGYLRVRYDGVVAVLIEALKEQDARIRKLEERLDASSFA